MKLLVAIIQPEELQAVQAVLDASEACLMSVSQVVGGRGSYVTEVYRGQEVRVPRPKLRLEITVHDDLVQETLEVIARARSLINSGHLGDGTVFVMQLDECVRLPGRRVASASGRH